MMMREGLILNSMVHNSIEIHEETVEDMVNLTELTEDSILRNLKDRFVHENIYTFTGTILVAMNPYQTMEIYTNEYVAKYKDYVPGAITYSPHIFCISQAAFYSMLSAKTNQTVIISGESGAGKTESTKLILQYLTSVTENPSWVDQQILEANTILESFGNAKTVRNNNSSRFGKFVQVHFDKSNSIIGAGILNYLLEKSRIVFQSVNERNYHVFYQLVAGTTPEEKEKWHILDSASKYAFLRGGFENGEIQDLDDKARFNELKLAYAVLKISNEDLESIFKCLSAILLLGNVNFKSSNDSVDIDENSSGDLSKIIELLSVDEKAFKTALTTRRFVARGETTYVPYKLGQALENRDSIAKAIYNNLFEYTVDFINRSTAATSDAVSFIGVLDIFGFELFTVNSFEQLCINYTNEKLQQFFNEFIFKLEQIEYQKEGISWLNISYADNSLCLELIEGKIGILSLLDEECRFPKGTDASFLSKINDSLNNEFYVKPRTLKNCFGIKHYAGEVIYTVTGFLDKNKDSIQDEIGEIFQDSKSAFLSHLFQPISPENDKRLKMTMVNSTVSTNSAAKASATAKKSTASTLFKGQLNSLVSILSSTSPHYVRCIKSNTQKRPFMFDDDLVLCQLKYSGMLQTIHIRKVGFPKRLSFEAFLAHFRYLLNSSDDQTLPKEKCLKVLNSVKDKLNPDQWQVGTSKVFLKASAMPILEEYCQAVILKYVLLIQKHFRRHYCEKKYTKAKICVLLIQKNAKKYVYRRKFNRAKIAIADIQRVSRGYSGRKIMKRLLEEKRLKEEEEKRIQAEILRQKLLEDEENRRLLAEEMLRQQEAAEMAELVRQTQDKLKNMKEIQEMHDMLLKRLQEEEKIALENSIKETPLELDFSALPLPQQQDMDPIRKVTAQEMFEDVKRSSSNLVKSIASLTQQSHNVIDTLSRSLSSVEPAEFRSEIVKSLSKSLVNINLEDVPVAIMKSVSQSVINLQLGEIPPALQSLSRSTSKLKLNEFPSAPTGNDLDDMFSFLAPYSPSSTKLVSLSEDSPSHNSAITNNEISQNRTFETNSLNIATAQLQDLFKDMKAENTALSSSYSSNLTVSNSSPLKSPIFDAAVEALFHQQKQEKQTLLLKRSIEELSVNTSVEDYSLSKLAEKYFGRIYDSTNTFTFGEQSPIPLNEMLMYSKIPLTGPLLKKTPNDGKSSLELFKNINHVLEAKLCEAESTILIIKQLVTFGIEYVDFRDELFIQAVKQTNPNLEQMPKIWNEISRNGWILLSIFSLSFSCSKEIFPYLNQHFEQSSTLKDSFENSYIGPIPDINHYATIAKNSLKKAQITGARRHAPSKAEISVLVNKDNFLVSRFYLLDGSIKAVPVSSNMTNAEVVDAIATKILLKEPMNWSLYASVFENSKETSRIISQRLLPSQDYFSDFICMQEGNSKDSKPKYFLRKRCFKNTFAEKLESVEYHLLFFQFSLAIQNNEFPVDQSTSLDLAAIRAQIIYGDFMQDAKVRYSNLTQLIPSCFVPTNDSQYKIMVSYLKDKHASLMGTKPLEAKVLFLETIKRSPFYGYTFFAAHHQGFWTYPDSILFGISSNGVVFVHLKTHAIIEEIPKENLIEWEINFEGELAIEYQTLSNKDENKETFKCESFYKEEIESLLNEYILKIDLEKKKKKSSVVAAKQFMETKYNSEMLWNDLDKARKNLLQSGDLRIPGPELFIETATKTLSKTATIKKAFTNTLKKATLTLSKTSLSNTSINGASSSNSNLRNSNGNLKSSNVNLKAFSSGSLDYSQADWQYSISRIPLYHSLSMMDGEDQYFDDDSIALSKELFHLIGLIHANGTSIPVKQINQLPHPALVSDAEISSIQGILSDALESVPYTNELYLQLIKMTTEIPETDSKHGMRAWKLFATAIGVVLPTANVLEYLKAHLRKYMHDPKMVAARREESSHANYCFKILNKSLMHAKTSKRKGHPSIEEVKAAFSLKSIHIRCGFADGSYRAILIDPTTTAAEANSMLCEKLQMKNANGFSLYQIFEDCQSTADGTQGTSSEMIVDDKIEENTRIVDILKDWEVRTSSFSATTTQRPPTSGFRFSFRKRLFLPDSPHNCSEREEELILSQAILDFCNGHIPVSIPEAARMVATRLIIEFKSFHKLPMSNLKGIICKHIPKTLQNSDKFQELFSLVEREFLSMEQQSISSSSANAEYLKIVQSWNYYGVKFFPVKQTYTDKLPSDFYLGVNNTGVHFFEKEKKDPIFSILYKFIASYAPSDALLMIVSEKPQRTKFVFLTKQAFQIALLIKDYTDALLKIIQHNNNK